MDDLGVPLFSETSIYSTGFLLDFSHVAVVFDRRCDVLWKDVDKKIYGIRFLSQSW